MNIDVSAFQQAFFDEAADLLADFESSLLHLEGQPNDSEVLNTVFRCAHSIKGGSATFGLPRIAKFTHGLETLLDKVRNQEIQLCRDGLQLLFESLDHLKKLFAEAQGLGAPAGDDEELTQRIESAAGSRSVPLEAAPEHRATSSPATYLLSLKPGADVLRQGTDIFLLLSKLRREVEVVSFSCDESALPHLDEMDPEASYLRWEIKLRTSKPAAEVLEVFEFIADESTIELHEVAEESSPRPAVVEAAPARAESSTLRVSADKMDRLINLVGELVINQSMLSEVTHGFTMSKLPRLMEAVVAMERASRELQERAMSMRLVPIRHAFSRFPRLVRDLSGASGKQVELKTSGDETELDKSLIEAMADPLTHLVRNSLDHGLETPADRRAAGKPETGTVSLRALQEGGNIVIEVSDDGRGLDRGKILRKAREKGMVGADGPDPSDEEIFACIFEPGFSTAAQITDVSGRGVGMDIVKQSIRAVNGSISLTSSAGKGTTFRIRLPLTMAILEGLSLAVGEEVYVLPLTSIVESIQPSAGDIHVLGGRDEVVRVRGEVIPLVRLYQIFAAYPRVTEPSECLLVIVENDGRKAALLVDELIGQSQVVIKSIETNHRKVDGIAGATILGDGRVALILDVPQLLRVHRQFCGLAA